MKRNNVTIVIITVIIMILSLLSVFIFYTVYKDIVGERKVNEWEELLNSKDYKVLYLGRKECTWCVKFKPVLEAIKEKYGVEYEYIDTDITSNFEELLVRLGENSENFGTPYTVIVKKGKKIGSLNGYTDAKTLFEFYKKYKLIDKEVNYEEIEINEAEIIIDSDKENYPNLNILTIEDYFEMLNNGGKQLLVVGQTTCGYCNMYKPILNEIAKEKNIVINYIDIATLKQTEYQEFINSLSFFNSKSWGTPLTLIIENNTVVDYIEGIREKKDTITYYINKGIVK